MDTHQPGPRQADPAQRLLRHADPERLRAREPMPDLIAAVRELQQINGGRPPLESRPNGAPAPHRCSPALRLSPAETRICAKKTGDSGDASKPPMGGCGTLEPDPFHDPADGYSRLAERPHEQISRNSMAKPSAPSPR